MGNFLDNSILQTIKLQLKNKEYKITEGDGTLARLTILTPDGQNFLDSNTIVQEMFRQNFEVDEFVKMFVRTGGQLNQNGEVVYGMMLPEKIRRRVQTGFSDKANGLINGYLGTQKKELGGTFGYVEPTIFRAGVASLKFGDYWFTKKLLNKMDVYGNNNDFSPIVLNGIYTANQDWNEVYVGVVKALVVQSLGRLGSFADQMAPEYKAKWETYKKERILLKDYKIDGSNHKTIAYEIVNDILTKLEYAKRIGKNDGTGVETEYYTSPSNTNKVIVLSQETNRKIILGAQDIMAQNMIAVSINKELGVVQNIAGTPTLIVDLPTFKKYEEANGELVEEEKTIEFRNQVHSMVKVPKVLEQFEVNWMIIQRGSDGAVAVPAERMDKTLIRPNSAGMETLEVILEMVKGRIGACYIQPELNFGSIKNSKKPETKDTTKRN